MDIRHSLLLLPSLTGVALAQSDLRGTVTSAETGRPLGYTIVTLYPHRDKQFTDARGMFAFEGTSAGSYLLSVRQIGYLPVDTQIVTRNDSPTTVRIVLRPLAIELPPVTIASIPCTNPGPPDSSDATLLAVFEQLRENARRYELLAESYPFQYTLELSDRTVYQRGDTGKPEVRKLRFSSRDDRPYHVGRVVEPAWGPWGNPANTVVIHSADLQHLGNETFIENHCFRLAGADTIGKDALVRIDFEPAKRIGTADMAGSAYLDPVTYELRYMATSLTRPERSELTDVRSMTFLTRFRNIAPGIPLQDSLIAITTYRYGGKRTKINTQRTLDIRFKRQPPAIPTINDQ
ncbi:MAG TPA: carboxypeptidase regulatory-like domain-containing protein [Gemmatimonadales bacterium]|nr:carboxypeptidase regulatory-like domain-containing protein [Gemmatimonadales bacterium]